MTPTPDPDERVSKVCGPCRRGQHGACDPSSVWPCTCEHGMTTDGERPSGTGLRGAIEALADEAKARKAAYPSHPHWSAWDHHESDLRDLLAAHPDPAAGTGLGLSEVLAEHRQSFGSNAHEMWSFCSCDPDVARVRWIGQGVPPMDSSFYPEVDQDRIAHLAAALEPVVAARVAEAKAIGAREALREAADRMPAFHDGDAPEWAITAACRWLRTRADQIERGKR